MNSNKIQHLHFGLFTGPSFENDLIFYNATMFIVCVDEQFELITGKHMYNSPNIF